MLTLALRLMSNNSTMLDNYKTDGTSVILPLATELNQAILCDDMPTLSPIQMEPTGRSVAQSYANAMSHP